MHDLLFKPADFFILRSPLYPIDQYSKILAQKDFVEFLFNFYDSHELLREAIFIASPSLHQALQKQQRSVQTATSLLAYLLRMSTRPTPFGLFSFVSVGQWDSKTANNLDLNKLCKRARPDMEWVYALVKNVYENETLFPSLPVRTNPLCVIKGDRAHLDYVRYTKVENKTSKKTASITINKLVQFILTQAHECIRIDHLYEKLQSFLTNLDKQKVYQVIQQLLSNQFLLPGILPSLLSHTPFEDLLGDFPITEDIHYIMENIKNYNTTLENGEQFLLNLQMKMSSLVNSKHYLQVDTYNPEKNITLPLNVTEEIQNAMTILWKIGHATMPSIEMASYREKFLDRYGYDRTVPLLELLDQEKGLGTFVHNEQNLNVTPPSQVSNLWEEWLTYEWQKAIFQIKEEIVIEEQTIDKLLKDSNTTLDYSKVPLSLDVFCKILAKTADEIDNQNFNIILSQTTWEGCSTIGRFLDLFDEETQKKVEDFRRQEEALENEKTLFFEVSYWPDSVRFANVAIHPLHRNYQLDLEEKTRHIKSIKLEDIYVGVTHDRFYLTFQNGDVELEACISNLLNHSSAPLPIRFLREVTAAKRQVIPPFFWGKLESKAIFLPRIRFKKTILSPAKWNLNATYFNKDTNEKIIAEFISWANQWRLPQKFLLLRGDHQLLLDRTYQPHLNEIATKIKQGISLQFCENHEDSWLKSDLGNHSSEIVIPFLRNSSQSKSSRMSIQPKAFIPIEFEKRWKLPSSEWLYIKFYLGREGMDRFITKHLTPLLECLLEKKIINSWFFIKYRDPETHIRLRVKLSAAETISYLLSEIEKFSISCMENGLIKKILFDSYEREVEKYGGPDLIGAAEELFHVDSVATSRLLQANLGKKLNWNEEVFHTLSVMSFLRGFNFDHPKIIDLLEYSKNHKDKLKGFRQHKKLILQLIGELENENPSGQVALLKEISSLRNESSLRFYQLAEQLSSEMQTSIYNNLLHMHCNRLGCDMNQENLVRVYVFHTLNLLKNKSDAYPKP